jgi:hypothetical protein
MEKGQRFIRKKQADYITTFYKYVDREKAYAVSDGPFYYWEIYDNKSNQKVIVIQQLVAHWDGKIFYPKDSKILNNFGGDLAVLTDLKKRT